MPAFTQNTQSKHTIAKRKSVNRQRAGKWWEMCQSYLVRSVVLCVTEYMVDPIAHALQWWQENSNKEATKVQRNGPTTHSNHHETAWKQKKKPIGMFVERGHLTQISSYIQGNCNYVFFDSTNTLAGWLTARLSVCACYDKLSKQKHCQPWLSISFICSTILELTYMDPMSIECESGRWAERRIAKNPISNENFLACFPFRPCICISMCC